jgi:flavin reductase
MTGRHSRSTAKKSETAASRELEGQFKGAMRRLAAGVALITTANEGRWFGMTATAVSSLCVEPPALTININRSASMYDHLVARGAFCVNFLREHHAEVCRLFSAASSEERFRHGSWVEDESGLPRLADSQASIVCEIGPTMTFGSHTIFVGKVTRSVIAEEISPLVYLNGGYFAARPAP